jgi:plastocyanin
MGRAWHVCVLGAGLVAGAVAGAACAADAAEARSITIEMHGQSFVPNRIEVVAGTHITWINEDDMPHSVTAADNRFDSGPVPAGKSFEWTAEGKGTFDYHCIFHPSMTAVLSVADGKRSTQPDAGPPQHAAVNQP